MFRLLLVLTDRQLKQQYIVYVLRAISLFSRSTDKQLLRVPSCLYLHAWLSLDEILDSIKPDELAAHREFSFSACSREIM